MLYRLDRVRKSYGAKEVLRDVTWQHNPGEKVGLVGKNGAGKTTLLRLVLGREEPDAGDVVRANAVRISTVEQALSADLDETLHDYVAGAFAHLHSIEAEMRRLEHAMAEGEGSPAVHDRYDALTHRFENEGGYDMVAEVDKALSGLGFDKAEFGSRLAELSGGQKNRAMLARSILSSPDVLLLDEPTNHLDFQAVEFLEEYLARSRSAYLVVTHDRRFLDRVADEIVELENGRLSAYAGGYSAYRRQKAERVLSATRAFEKQQEFIEKEQDYIRRNIAGVNSRQAKGRRTKLARVERLERPTEDGTSVGFRFDTARIGGRTFLRATGLDAGYAAGDAIVRGVRFELLRGERLALLGENASGKTTLLKTLAGRLAPRSGTVETGHDVSIGYYDQELSDLDPRQRVIDAVWEEHPEETEEEMRSYLARFAFRGDDVFASIAGLSGGEKGRLTLAVVMRQRHNLLLLDEPTNHLDLDSREELEESLDDFPGSIVFVSHDRAFIDRLATRILDLREGRPMLFDGNYTDTAQSRAERRSKPEAHVREVLRTPSSVFSPTKAASRGKRAPSAEERESARNRGARGEDRGSREGDRSSGEPALGRGADARPDRGPPARPGEGRTQGGARHSRRGVGETLGGRGGARGAMREAMTSRAAIIAIGTEMLGPLRRDTNSLWLTERLEEAGIAVVRKAVVGDDPDEIARELSCAVSTAGWVFTTGGLGPTADDVTVAAIAKWAGLPVRRDQDFVAAMRERWERRGVRMPAVNEKQADFPEGARVLPNPRGTAPGLWLEKDGAQIVVLPGVPSEMREIYERGVAPKLAQGEGETTRRRVLRIAGMAESAVEERIASVYKKWKDDPVTILAAPGEVELHLCARGDPSAIDARLASMEEDFRAVLPGRIHGRDGESLAASVGRLLKAKRKTLALAESCTGGLVSALLTDVPGSSAYFLGTVVPYADSAKEALLGVSAETIRGSGAVSEETAREMARGARARFGSDVAAAVTGIAGPDGGSPEKPVGTVFFAVADRDGREEAHKRLFGGDRDVVRRTSAMFSLEMIRRFLIEAP